MSDLSALNAHVLQKTMAVKWHIYISRNNLLLVGWLWDIILCCWVGGSGIYCVVGWVVLGYDTVLLGGWFWDMILCWVGGSGIWYCVVGWVVLGYDTVLLGGWFPLLQMVVMPPSSGSDSPRRNSLWTAWHWNMKAPESFKMSGTAHPVTQYHIPEDVNPQQHHYENLKCHKSDRVLTNLTTVSVLVDLFMQLYVIPHKLRSPSVQTNWLHLSFLVLEFSSGSVWQSQTRVLSLHCGCAAGRCVWLALWLSVIETNATGSSLCLCIINCVVTCCALCSVKRIFVASVRQETWGKVM